MADGNSKSKMKKSKRPGQKFLDEQTKAKRPKLSTTQASRLVCCFVRFAWDENWGELENMKCSKIASCLLEVKKKDTRDTCPTVSDEICSRLRFILPLLRECSGDVNYANEYGETVLHVLLDQSANKGGAGPDARADKFLHIVDELLKMGASVLRPDIDGWSPIFSAFKNSQVEVIWKMLPYVKNFKAADPEGHTVLHKLVQLRALKAHKLASVIRQVTMLSNCNQPNNCGESVVHLAAEQCDTALLALFKKHGADMNAKSLEDKTPLLLFSRNCKDRSKYDTALKLLASPNCDMDAIDEEGYTALHYAAGVWGCSASVRRLLELGANPNPHKDEARTSPLHLALLSHRTSSRPDIVRALLESKADVHFVAWDQLEPIHVAAARGITECLGILLDAGAASTAKGPYTMQPIHIAALAGHDETLRELLARRVDVNSVSKGLMTPLHLAAMCGHLNSVKALVEFGAAVNSLDDRAFTPLQFACLYKEGTGRDRLVENREHFAKFLISPIMKIFTAKALKNADNSHGRVIAYLVEQGADINWRASMGWTPLHFTCVTGRRGLSGLLLDLGAFASPTNADGELPFDYALRTGRHVIAVRLAAENLKVLSENSILDMLTEGGRLTVPKPLLNLLAKMQAANLGVADIYSEVLREWSEQNPQLWAKIRREASGLAKIVVPELETSVLQLVQADARHRARLRRQLPKNFSESSFPNYYPLVISLLKSSKQQKKFVEVIKNAWAQIFLAPMPEICILHILWLTSSSELFRLTQYVVKDDNDEVGD